MKELVINGCLKTVRKNFPDYSEEKISEVKYGLESIYIMITKLLVIALLACFLNLFKEVVIFLLIYNIIRTFSFGLHATKSWICLIASTIAFILVPFICKTFTIGIWYKAIMGIITILLFFKNAPADTKKRPIVNKKRRLFFKYTSTIIAIIFAFASILIKDNFVANCFILASVVQCFMISPAVYKLFGLSYNNYLQYQTI